MTSISINGTLVYTIETYAQWVNRFPGAIPKIPQVEKYLFVDNNGNIATCGEDFMDAQNSSAFPIKVYLLARTSHSLNPDYLKKLQTLLK